MDDGTGGAHREPRPGVNLRELARGAAWLVGIAAAVRTIYLFIGQNPLAAAVVSVVLVELATSRAGLIWLRSASGNGWGRPLAPVAPVAPIAHEAPSDSDKNARPTDEEARAANTEKDALPEDQPVPSRRSGEVQPSKEDAARGQMALRGIGLGAGLGLVAVACTILVAIPAGWARVEAGSPSTGLVWALIRTAATSARDELLLRGLVLHTAERAGLSPRVGIAFAALAGGASIALLPGAEVASVALAVAAGWLAAVLWLRAGGAWAAIGVHLGWALFSGVGIRGSLLDVLWASGSLGDGTNASGAPAWIAAILFSVMAVAVSRITKRAEPPRAT
jgi:hypothetical protein